ncbi:hypothetical protein GCM10010508_69390 [Streptomyces naganishii JCM 4654]|uniref:Uncharacterized protein n=2 Tax=Streptomyces naganishii TaxID=285447 RepID=A0A918YB45_9ACTN|nr:hypothetical protein GCM10010508_69390 [Streptomyces naganishii JCM 4654]
MPQPVGRYVYWSQRLVTEVIDDNGVRLDPRIKPALNLGLAGNGVSLAGRDQENTTFDIAEKLKKKLRKSIITDFSTLASGKLVQGSGHAEVAEFQTWGYPQHRLQQRTAVIHTQAVTREGRVDLCLFGSLKNLRGFAVPEEDSVGGWTSSAAPMIEEFIALRGAEVSTRTGREFPFDEEQLAVEILKVALSQGIYTDPADHLGRPETRAYTLLGFDATEYVALVYRDVVLTPGRWDFRVEPELEGVRRILIGAPLWMRTTRQDSIRRYFGENRVVIPRALGASRTPAIAPSQGTPPDHSHVLFRPSQDGEPTQN